MATAPDISKLSYAELQRHVAEASERLASRRDEELKTLVDGWAKKAAASGFTPQEVIDLFQTYLPTKTKRAKGTSVAKYRDPKTGDVWSGKGRTARWLAAHIEAGKKKEDFLVK